MTTLFLLISDSDSSTTTSHNLDDFISMDPTVGIGDVLHLMDFVGRFFRHLWIVKSIINYQLYIQRCHFAYDIQQTLTMKKRFDEKKKCTLMVKVIAAASFKNAVLKTIHTLTTSGSANNRRVPKLLLLTILHHSTI